MSFLFLCKQGSPPTWLMCMSARVRCYSAEENRSVLAMPTLSVSELQDTTILGSEMTVWSLKYTNKQPHPHSPT